MFIFKNGSHSKDHLCVLSFDCSGFLFILLYLSLLIMWVGASEWRGRGNSGSKKEHHIYVSIQGSEDQGELGEFCIKWGWGYAGGKAENTGKAQKMVGCIHSIKNDRIYYPVSLDIIKTITHGKGILSLVTCPIVAGKYKYYDSYINSLLNKINLYTLERIQKN